MTLSGYAYTVLFAPLLGALLSGTIGLRLTEKFSSVLTIFFMLISTFAAFTLIYHLGWNQVFSVDLLTWHIHKDYTLNFGCYLDALSLIMIAIVTSISLLVHIYSVGYMHDDPHQPRFFSYLSLFTFMMLLLVTANNLIMLFVGWEGVGLVSYLLIGFWFYKKSAVHANYKAFIINRVSDIGLFLGIAGFFHLVGSFDLQMIISNSASSAFLAPTEFASKFSWCDFLAFCLLFGAIGKSAQVPFHIWLPDSMEGPTPISALIHAATMVTAGIYLLARLSFIVVLSPPVMHLIFLIGMSTMLISGLIAINQNDIKKIIAYSTLSQLGYMVMACGVGAFNLGIFHLGTHAFFKALLFLTAGGIIIAMHHEQDINKMGRLYLKEPFLCVMMLIGTLAILGLPPFAGFYSKDLILHAIDEKFATSHKFYPVLANLGVMITSIYSFRLFLKVFVFEPAEKNHALSDLHEVDWTVKAPLLILSLFSVVAGVVGHDLIINQKILDPALAGMQSYEIASLIHFKSALEFAKKGLISIPVLLIFVGLMIALLFPAIKKTAITENYFFRIIRQLVHQKFYFEIAALKISHFFMACSSFLSDKLDKILIDFYLIDGAAVATNFFGTYLKKIQVGVLRYYLLAMIFAITLLSLFT